MTKWELAQLMGLELSLCKYSDGDIYDAYAYDTRLFTIFASNIEEAQANAANRYFERINNKCFNGC